MEHLENFASGAGCWRALLWLQNAYTLYLTRKIQSALSMYGMWGESTGLVIQCRSFRGSALGTAPPLLSHDF